MSTVVLHFGFPKAASTSLQNGAFLNLHNAGHINFLGRAFEREFFGAHVSRQEFNAWIKGLPEESGSQPGSEFQPSSHSVNLLSDNRFMLRKFVYGDPAPMHLLVKKAHRVFAEIRLVFVIRRQADLIRSNYIQRYQTIKEKNFSRFLEKGYAGTLGEFDMYRFDKVFDTYRRDFPDARIEILFFEDLVKDKAAFASALGGVLDLPSDVVVAHLGDTHLNARRKTRSHDVVSKTKHLGGVREQVSRVARRLGLHGMDRVLSTKIATMTDQQRSEVADHFREANRRLQRDYNLDRERMEFYGYL